MITVVRFKKCARIGPFASEGSVIVGASARADDEVTNTHQHATWHESCSVWARADLGAAE